MTQPDHRSLPTERLEEMVRDPRLPARLKAQVQDELLRRFMAESAPSGPPGQPPTRPYPGVPQGPPPVQPRPVPPRQVPPRQMHMPPPVAPPAAPPAPAPPPRPAKGSSPVGWVLLGVFLAIAGLVLAAGYFASQEGGGGDEIQYSSRCYVTSINWCPLAVTVAVGSPCTCTDVATGVVAQGVVR